MNYLSTAYVSAAGNLLQFGIPFKDDEGLKRQRCFQAIDLVVDGISQTKLDDDTILLDFYADLNIK